MNIKAMQHIFGSVDKNHSYQNVSGFQTIFFSSGLNQEDIRKIEGKLSYFNYNNEPIAKIVFYPMDKGLYLISRIVASNEADNFGRTGLYLCHSIVINEQDFASVSFNPFIVLEALHNQFINSITEALSLGNTKTGNIPELSINITDEHIDACSQLALKELQYWDSYSINMLINCAVHHEQLLRQRQSLVIIGNSESIINILRAIFSLVPSSVTRHLSFDSHFYRCSNAGSYFWSVGYPVMASSMCQNIIVNAQQRKLNVANQTMIPPHILESWIYKNIDRRQFAYLIHGKNTANYIVDVLEAKTEKNIADQNLFPEVTKELFQMNWPTVVRLITKKITEVTGPALTARLLDNFLIKFRHANNDYQLAILRDGPDIKEISDNLVIVFFDQVPSPRELNEINKLIERKKHEILQSLFYYWQKDFNKLRSQVEQLTDDNYNRVIQLLLAKVPLHTLFCLNKITIFLDIFTKAALRNTKIAKLTPSVIKKLMQSRCQGHLILLIPVLHFLNRQELDSIKKMTCNQIANGIPTDFSVALDQALYEKNRARNESKLRSFIFKVIRR